MSSNVAEYKKLPTAPFDNDLLVEANVVPWLSQIQSREVFQPPGSRGQSRSDSTRVQVLWMSLKVSKYIQELPSLIIHPSAILSTLISLSHILTSHLLILAQVSFPYGSCLHFSVGVFFNVISQNHVLFLQNTYLSL